MPNIPNVPGVPALSSYIDFTVTLLVADAIGLLFGSANPWGVFLDGEVAFDYDSFNSIGFRKEGVAADYQVEAPGDGASSGFMSYDKVLLPFEVRVRMISGGTERDRALLLRQIEAAQASLDLFDIVTPERFYTNCNLVRYNYERTGSEGVGVVKIDAVFQEIRSSEAAAFTNTQQPGSSAQSGLGNVQPRTIPGPGNIQSFPLASVQ